MKSKNLIKEVQPGAQQTAQPNGDMPQGLESTGF